MDSVPNILSKVEVAPRWADGHNWNCTGSIQNVIVEVSLDGENWTAVTPEGGLDISDKIVNEADMSLFPVSVEFEKAEAKYVRISGTESYHWQAANENKFITVGDVVDYLEKHC